MWLQGNGEALGTPSAAAEGMTDEASPSLGMKKSTLDPSTDDSTWELEPWQAGLADRLDLQLIVRMVEGLVLAADVRMIHMNQNFGAMTFGKQSLSAGLPKISCW
jgi:hypothetical protein